FFSSSGRHTRSYGDWSSDVCSSDLIRCVVGRCRGAAGRRAAKGWPTQGGEGRQGAQGREGAAPPQGRREAAHALAQEDGGRRRRSEERRVGKECRAKGARERGQSES